MSKAALRITKSQINRWFLVQITVIVMATLVGLVFRGLFIAKSIFLGGLLGVFPQWIFSLCWLRYYKASRSPQIVKMFYIGELIKLLLIAALFILALIYVHFYMLSFLIGFMVAQIAFWIAPLIWSNKLRPNPTDR